LAKVLVRFVDVQSPAVDRLSRLANFRSAAVINRTLPLGASFVDLGCPRPASGTVFPAVRADEPSTTAMYVAMGRALAHARRSVPRFDDPFAMQLLPDEGRAAVHRVLTRALPRSRHEAWLDLVARATEKLMGPRTVEIDDAVRAMIHGHQLVIIGAGLDARAYRMPELAESIVFEIDHPATQAWKRERARGLSPCARELRHVAVDFSRDDLGDALHRAGHDASKPTAWIFEGVISYLTRNEVEASIDVLSARSSPGSRLVATYNEPDVVRRAFSVVTARSGEPQRFVATPSAMRRLLAARGFVVQSDRDGIARARRIGSPPNAIDYLWARFHHVVVADRA
jgi:methyltransferase (TIGR00027 family)